MLFEFHLCFMLGEGWMMWVGAVRRFLELIFLGQGAKVLEQTGIRWLFILIKFQAVQNHTNQNSSSVPLRRDKIERSSSQPSVSKPTLLNLPASTFLFFSLSQSLLFYFICCIVHLFGLWACVGSGFDQSTWTQRILQSCADERRGKQWWVWWITSLWQNNLQINGGISDPLQLFWPSITSCKQKTAYEIA